jgi:hypothetical protein
LRPHYFSSELSKISKCDVLLCCHDVDRSLTINNQAYSPLIDPIHEKISIHKIKCQSLSLPWSTMGCVTTFNKSIIFNREYLFQLIKDKISKSKKYYAHNKIFKKTEVKFVIGIGLTPDLCRAAKMQNVVTIELLHGIGYTFIPWGWKNLGVKDLPDKILVLDDVSEKTFRPLMSKGVQVIKIAHPFYEKILNPNYSLPKEWMYIATKDKKNVLITLQWGYGGEITDLNGILNNGLFYDELEYLIAKRPDITWHFRLHPEQMKGDMSKRYIPYIRDFSKKYSNIIWEKSSTVPLASVAKVCDVNITMSSMSCYDVAIFGVPSLVLCPTTRGDGIHGEYFADLIHEGYVFKKKFDIKFIEKWIDITRKKDSRSSKFVEQHGWNEFIIEIKNNLR